MRRLGVLAAVAALLVVPGRAAADEPFRTPGDATYQLELRADADGVHWQGHESIDFENTGPQPLNQVWLRLWGNGLGGCRIPLVTVHAVVGARAGTPGVGCTSLVLLFTSPLQPGARAFVSFDISIDVPDRNDRFGRVRGVSLVGNAIPLLAIEDGRGPHLQPYVAIGESFYSQIANFSLGLDVPKAMAVAASGRLVERHVSAPGRVHLTFEADRVRDVAWAAGPLHQLVAPVRPGLVVRTWYAAPTTAEVAQRAQGWAVEAMRKYESAFGRYPYGEVDVVLVPFQRFGGMEYPTLVMASTFKRAVVHELAHQWWYGLVGDDEYSEPWLDEAFATWSEGWADGTASVLCRDAPWPSAQDRLTRGMDWWADHPRRYSPVVYRRGACVLESLSELFGQSRFLTLLHRYIDAHRLGWSTTDDFVSAVDTEAQQFPQVDLHGFWAKQRIDTLVPGG